MFCCVFSLSVTAGPDSRNRHGGSASESDSLRSMIVGTRTFVFGTITRTSTMSFAETSNIRIRGYRESDLDKLVALLDDSRTSRSGPGYVLPKGEATLKKEFPEMLGKMFMFCIIESKEPLEDGSNFAGIMQLLNNGSPKNRAVMLGICLDHRFWGRKIGEELFVWGHEADERVALGTEATKWIVDHAFKQLGMHRVVCFCLRTDDRLLNMYVDLGYHGRQRPSNRSL
jgi:RimJ/RimL family protein N-acetyltransferase